MVRSHLFDRNTARMVDNQSAETGPHLEHMLTVLMVTLGEWSVVRVVSTLLTALLIFKTESSLADHCQECQYITR